MPALNPTEIVFGGDPDAPLRVAKLQDVRCAPRSCGTIAPLSHFCSAGRLRRGFFPFFNPLFSNPLTLFSPCTTPACRSVGENMLFRRALRSLRGLSPLAGAIVAARRTSQHLAQQRGVFAFMPALNPTENSFGGDPDAPLRNARRSLCSSFLRNYRAALSFLLREVVFFAFLGKFVSLCRAGAIFVFSLFL